MKKERKFLKDMNIFISNYTYIPSDYQFKQKEILNIQTHYEFFFLFINHYALERIAFIQISIVIRKKKNIKYISTQKCIIPSMLKNLLKIKVLMKMQK